MAQVTVTKRWHALQPGLEPTQYFAELSNGEVVGPKCSEYYLQPAINERLAELNKVEQVYSDDIYTFAFSEVLYIEATNVDQPDRGHVVLRNSRWSPEMDMWDNAPYFPVGLRAVIEQYKAWVEAQAS